jgi:hypothetical protein
VARRKYAWVEPWRDGVGRARIDRGQHMFIAKYRARTDLFATPCASRHDSDEVRYLFCRPDGYLYDLNARIPCSGGGCDGLLDGR